MMKLFYKDIYTIRDKIFRFALKLLNNYEEAQDVTQDIIEKTWKKKALVNKCNNVEALMMKMTKDLCLDRLKYQKNKTEKLKNLNIANTYIEQNNDVKDLVQITRTLIDNLPEKQKMIIHLRDVEGYEYEEIVNLLEIDINAIRMNLSRARKSIREQILKISNHGL